MRHLTSKANEVLQVFERGRQQRTDDKIPSFSRQERDAETIPSKRLFLFPAEERLVLQTIDFLH